MSKIIIGIFFVLIDILFIFFIGYFVGSVHIEREKQVVVYSSRIDMYNVSILKRCLSEKRE